MNFDDWLEKQTGLHALANAKADAPKMTDDKLVFRDLGGNVWRKGVYFISTDNEIDDLWQLVEIYPASRRAFVMGDWRKLVLSGEMYPKPEVVTRGWQINSVGYRPISDSEANEIIEKAKKKTWDKLLNEKNNGINE